MEPVTDADLVGKLTQRSSIIAVTRCQFYIVLFGACNHWPLVQKTYSSSSVEIAQAVMKLRQHIKWKVQPIFTLMTVCSESTQQ